MDRQWHLPIMAQATCDPALGCQLCQLCGEAWALLPLWGGDTRLQAALLCSPMDRRELRPQGLSRLPWAQHGVWGPWDSDCCPPAVGLGLSHSLPRKALECSTTQPPQDPQRWGGATAWQDLLVLHPGGGPPARRASETEGLPGSDQCRLAPPFVKHRLSGSGHVIRWLPGHLSSLHHPALARGRAAGWQAQRTGGTMAPRQAPLPQAWVGAAGPWWAQPAPPEPPDQRSPAQPSRRHKHRMCLAGLSAFSSPFRRKSGEVINRPPWPRPNNGRL